jgi:hypothetical protein
VPCHGTIEKRFGGLLPVYRLLGYTPDRYHVRAERLRNLSDEEMLNALRKLLREHGYLSEKLLVASKDMPSVRAYRKRFGRMTRAYKLIGYKPERQPNRRVKSLCQQ